MADIGISVQLQGLDQVNRGLDSVGTRAKSLSATVSNTGSMFGGLGKALTDASRASETAWAKTTQLTGAFSTMKGVVAGLGLVALFGEAKHYIDDTLTSLEQLGRTSRALGVSSDDLQKWHFAAERMGVSATSIDEALKFLNRTMGEMKLGGPATPAVALFEKLADGMTDVQRKSLSTADAFRAVISGLQRIPDASTRTRVGLEVLGKGAEEFLIAANDPAQWNYLIQHFDELGLGVNKNVIDYFGDAHSKVKDLGAQLENLATIGIAGVIKGSEDLATWGTKLGIEWKIEAAEAGTLVNELTQVGRYISGPLTDAYQTFAQQADKWRDDMFPKGWKPFGSGFPSTTPQPQTPAPPTLSRDVDISSIPQAMLNRPLNIHLATPEEIEAAKKFTQTMAALTAQYADLTQGVAGSTYVTTLNQALVKAGIPLTGMLTAAQETERKKIDAMAMSVAEETQNIQDVEEAGKLWEAQIKERSQLIDQNKTASEQYADELDRINRLLGNDPEQLAKAVANLNQKYEQMDDIAKGIGDAFGNNLEKAITSGNWKNIGKSIGKDIETTLVHELIAKPISDAIGGALSGLAGHGGIAKGLGDELKGLLSGLGKWLGVDSPFLDKLHGILQSAWNALPGILDDAWGLLKRILGGIGGSGGAGNLIGEGISAIGSLLGFAGGGDLTVTKPQLIMVGERGPERIRVNPMAGGHGGDGGYGGGIHIHLPQSSVISNLTAGTFARQIARAVARENRRRV